MGTTINSSRFLFGRKTWFVKVGLGIVGFILAASIATIAFELHLNLSSAGLLELVAVVLVALRWGFFQATVVSITGVLCLDFLFTAPLFQLSIADAQNYVTLVTFEATALLVSGLSSKVQLHAAEAERQRRRSAKLYELSRAILLVDGRALVTEQIASLIREIIGVEAVDFWISSQGITPTLPDTSDNLAYEVFRSGKDADDAGLGISSRILRLGTTPIGAMTLRGGEGDPLLADAVASLSAIAIERAHALQRENRAEAERNTEQLRTAVLDGLAHGFKTPLTAIQTASSGLLAIDNLSPPQMELVSIINERTTVLSQLCTRLLQTAALESRDIRLRRKSTSVARLLHHVLEEQNEETRARIIIEILDGLSLIDVDAQMVELAVLQLVDNAAKYSDVGSTIAVIVKQSESETVITVANSGPPIEPAERERIFQRFYRGSHASRGPSGTGLGLSIVKKTAEAHGGTAWVDSEDGLNRFSFALQHFRKAGNG